MPVDVMTMMIHVMAMGVDPVTETIVPWCGEIMVRINIPPAVVVAVAVMTMMVPVVRVAAAI
jgi:hypothetical protein